MDPAMFRLDWEVLTEVLAAIIVLSLFVERAMAVVFEHRYFVNNLSETGLKEPIALLAAFATVYYWNFDALSITFHADQPSWFGYALTAGIVSGGSKGSVKLFHDVLNLKSTALRAYEKGRVAAPSLNKPVEPSDG